MTCAIVLANNSWGGKRQRQARHEQRLQNTLAYAKSRLGVRAQRLQGAVNNRHVDKHDEEFAPSGEADAKNFAPSGKVGTQVSQLNT